MITAVHKSVDRSEFASLMQLTTKLRMLSAILLTSALISVGCQAQNGNDVPAGTPTASFAVSAAAGLPGLMVQFTDTSTGEVDSYLWDFGNNVTSTDRDPLVSFPDAGVYDVSLTVTGGRGTSTMTSIGAVSVMEMPVADFECSTAEGFAPLLVSCTNSALFATTTEWSFENQTTGAITLSGAANPALTLDTAATYTVTQTVTNAVGSDSTSSTIEVFPLSITASPPSGNPPGNIAFSADAGGATPFLLLWVIDGVLVGGSSTILVPLRTPGTYQVELTFGTSGGSAGSASLTYVVGYGPPTALFSVDESEGDGPHDVVFTDESTGDVDEWLWDFGDGNGCVFPVRDPVSESDPETCSSSSPSHTYARVGRFDVSLTVTGPAEVVSDPAVGDTLVRADLVTLTIMDASFEDQVVAEPEECTQPVAICGAWSPVVPASPTATAEHIWLSDQQVEGADAGMPTEGQKWAALDGLGTDGSETALIVENGIRQTFVPSATNSVLEFDYVFLYAEPPAGAVLDAMTATVSDGLTTVEIPSAVANVTTPYVGSSSRYPNLDGGTTRATAVQTASLDVAAAFPGAASDTIYTLTIRLTNALNDLRSPRAYVDNIRFSAPAASLVANFSAPTVVVAGEPADFMDLTCPDPGAGLCEVPTSWRWDFDTHGASNSPAATGSGEQDPSYTFTIPGPYDVRLLARLGDQESSVIMTVPVVEAPVAIPTVFSATSTTAPADITFEDKSTSAEVPPDPIVAWNWDFAGWGVSSLETPPVIRISQAGTWTIRLTVTTASGLMATGTVDVVLD